MADSKNEVTDKMDEVTVTKLGFVIPLSLVINADLLPVGNEQIYATWGAYDVKVVVWGDKQ